MLLALELIDGVDLSEACSPAAPARGLKIPAEVSVSRRFVDQTLSARALDYSHSPENAVRRGARSRSRPPRHQPVERDGDPRRSRSSCSTSASPALSRRAAATSTRAPAPSRQAQRTCRPSRPTGSRIESRARRHLLFCSLGFVLHELADAAAAVVKSDNDLRDARRLVRLAEIHADRGSACRPRRRRTTHVGARGREVAQRFQTDAGEVAAALAPFRSRYDPAAAAAPHSSPAPCALGAAGPGAAARNREHPPRGRPPQPITCHGRRRGRPGAPRSRLMTPALALAGALTVSSVRGVAGAGLQCRLQEVVPARRPVKMAAPLRARAVAVAAAAGRPMVGARRGGPPRSALCASVDGADVGRVPLEPAPARARAAAPPRDHCRQRSAAARAQLSTAPSMRVSEVPCRSRCEAPAEGQGEAQGRAERRVTCGTRSPIELSCRPSCGPLVTH